MPLNRLETSFDEPLRKKKDRLDFLYHICGLDVHCFCPPREKNDDIHYFFLMMHNCSYKFNNYIRLCLERIESNQTGSSDWLESTSTAVKIWHIKVIPQEKKKLSDNFQNFFL